MNTRDAHARAVDVLKENDRGTYTVPTKGLYPFQWNWDSCLTALGQRHYDEARAWIEIETLFAHQWEDGMVPHIIFHAHSDGYFPGPDIWQTGRAVATSGITQPPVAGFAVKRLFDGASDRSAVAERARRLIPKIDAWHRWFHATRDPHGEGLVAILHPWESGRDNSVDWDEAFGRVPTAGVGEYTRRDTQHADPAHRPTKDQYDRYLWLVQHFRAHGWDNAKLHDASPFQVIDPGFNAILIRSCADLADLAEALGETEVAAANRARAAAGLAAIESLWSEAHGQYLCRDRTVGALIDSASIGGLLPAFAAIPARRVKALARTIERQSRTVRFLLPSQNPADPRFESKRYWRGPAWLVTNYMIANGFAASGETAMADQIVASSLDLIARSGFAEYYDPISGEPCGGGRFTWTAAIVIEFLQQGRR
ncbi:MAG: trehalase family glycosidase [Cucumibacter sp.]